jgi:hypothetical protein
MSGRVSWLNLGGSDGSTIADAATSSFTGNSTMAIGWAMALGDIDGDGIEDAVISGPLTSISSDRNGGVAIFWDVPSHMGVIGMDLVVAADASVIGGDEDGYLGTTVALMGDIDGDGMGEILITEPGAGGGLGTIWVVSSGALSEGPDEVASVALLGIEGQYTTANTGNHLVAADFDGDGIDDIVIAADGHPTPGTVGLVPTGRVSIYLSGGALE